MKRSISAFTLIELMVVVVIIVLLAALGATVYFSAMQSAREIKTISTIIKLDETIAEIYESYESKFNNIENFLNPTSHATFNNNKASIDMPRLKRQLICDLMRMEMPSNQAEVNNPPQEFNNDGSTTSGAPYQLANSEVKDIYSTEKARPNSIVSNLATESAELLYLIVVNLAPEALENFTSSEIGDTDNDGLMEFIDGWGRPIAFIRFAPGFTDTDRQPDVIRIREHLGKTPSIPADHNVLTDLSVSELGGILNQWSDPFNPNTVNDVSWFLYPVIMSAGRDGQFGIIAARNASPAPAPAGISLDDPGSAAATLSLDPFSSGVSIGLPDGRNTHHDNIHNHANFR
jgi:prepilin-type N-terminal cleavage/methylation domain-containing protein